MREKITISLQAPDANALRTRALEQETSISDVVRQALARNGVTKSAGSSPTTTTKKRPGGAV